ncbi:hypothetical protein SLEP1_g29151 [Rubroshorea leprosula]|uniref:At1g61320/AtMIF1 LRR domain-containing protein n=1 Tax=Rubroshorea leprosula TaxID=152421 RepID=A0AAV5JVZ0_9ROSI|nr:hypothetical protein SLEP1_g29151 [Rubroshorea leprosula]
MGSKVYIPVSKPYQCWQFQHFAPTTIFFQKINLSKFKKVCFGAALTHIQSIWKLSLVFYHKKGSIFLKNDDCPSLEHLVLKSCLGVKSFHISNLRHLHILNVSFGCYSFELVVASQSIQTLYIYAMSKPWSIINIDGCRHLKLLYLLSMTITDKELHSLLSKLTLIEELYLNYCHHLKTIKISNPCLKTVIFVCAVSSHLHILEIAAPSLENFMFLADSRVCRINVTGCCNLKTLVLKKHMGPEATFHDLFFKCPSLENLWLVQCTELQRLQLLNPRLKRVHVVRCCKLNAVKVDSPNLFEFSCTSLEAPRITVVGAMKASSGVRFDSEHGSRHCSGRGCSFCSHLLIRLSFKVPFVYCEIQLAFFNPKELINSAKSVFGESTPFQYSKALHCHQILERFALIQGIAVDFILSKV